MEQRVCCIAGPRLLPSLPLAVSALRHRHATHRCRCMTRCSSQEDNRSTSAQSGQPSDSRSASEAATRPLPPANRAEDDIGEREIRRETFAGKVAILSLGAMLLGERLTGRGIVATLKHDTGVPLWEMEPLLALGVLGLLVVALYPSKTPLLTPGQKAQSIWTGAQRFVGRIACLLMAGTIVTEVVTGKGALKLFNIETGKEVLDEAEIAVAFFALLFLTASPPDGMEKS